MYYQKFTVVGNLGADAELRTMPNGGSVATWSMAETRRYKTKDGEQKEETNWWRCKLYGNAADSLAQYLTKGKGVLVEGRLEQRKYDKEMDLEDEDGVTHTVTVPTNTVEVNVKEIQLLPGRGGEDEAPAPAAKPAAKGKLTAKVQEKAKAAKPAAKAAAASMFDDEDDDGDAPF